MDGTRIDSILRRDQKCSPMFSGVFACDRLPTRLNDRQFPILMVCNTDPHDKPGEHWIVKYIENSSYGEYFDSFGRPLDIPFKSFLNRYCDRWIFNERHLQSAISHYCGHYCIFYCLHRARNKNVNALNKEDRCVFNKHLLKSKFCVSLLMS